jgi:4-amino-4-deoxy-L-arabinose transferase-like glycosyltransferase
MSIAEHPRRGADREPAPVLSSPLPGLRGGDGRLRWGLAIGAVLLLALGLRLWGVDHGLPYAYNADENAHFVTRAIGIFGHDWNPNYYVNPPAYTYLVHLALGVAYGGRAGVSSAFATDPTGVWILGRVLAGLLGTLATWLLYLAGSRLVDRRVGLLAAGLMTVAFLPVFYSKLALNDVPTTAGVCLALWGAAGVLRFGRTRDYVFAGIGPTPSAAWRSWPARRWRRSSSRTPTRCWTSAPSPRV